MSQSGAFVVHVIRLEEVAWGLLLIAVTMVMHAFAMQATLTVCAAAQRRRARLPGFFSSVYTLLIASLLIVIAHLLEVIVWALFFYLRGALPTSSAAYYYALLQYTTVGSELMLTDRWHLLGGMFAIAGLLTFAWSTTVLLTLAQQCQDALQPTAGPQDRGRDPGGLAGIEGGGQGSDRPDGDRCAQGQHAEELSAGRVRPSTEIF